MRYCTRRQLVNLVYDKVKELGHFVPKDTIYVTNKAFLAVMLDILKNDDELCVNEIFKLKRKWVNGRYFKTVGKDIHTEGHWGVGFYPGSALKRACQEETNEEENTDFYEDEE